ncbi:MAG: orotidine-5'-phosphate decarboxylase [Actinomycetota bacterium]
MTRERIDPPIAIALDYGSLDEAKRTIDALAEQVRVFKVGLQLFTAAGPAAVRAVHDRGCDVFLDLKVGDIPNTAAGAVASAAGIGARFLTIHSSGGPTMVRAAVEAAAGGAPKLLVVSVLTSLDEAEMAATGVMRPLSDQVDAMAALAVAAGAPGLVLAATEVARIRAAYPDLFLLVPGIRPAWAQADDQKRMGTPAQVVADGADLMVLGRAVTAAADPSGALARVLEEINGVKV